MKRRGFLGLGWKAMVGLPVVLLAPELLRRRETIQGDTRVVARGEPIYHIKVGPTEISSNVPFTPAQLALYRDLLERTQQQREQMFYDMFVYGTGTMTTPWSETKKIISSAGLRALLS